MYLDPTWRSGYRPLKTHQHAPRLKPLLFISSKNLQSIKERMKQKRVEDLGSWETLAYSDGLQNGLNKTTEQCKHTRTHTRAGIRPARVVVMWLLFIWCEKWFKVNEMESVAQSITGTGVVYFPSTHHLLHLALAMILSVLLSRTLTQQCVAARLISPGGAVRMRGRTGWRLRGCAAFFLFLSIYSHLRVSWCLGPQPGR